MVGSVNSTGSARVVTSARSEPPPSAEFDAALKHYRQRFAKIVERAGGGVQQVVSRFATWLDTDNAKATTRTSSLSAPAQARNDRAELEHLGDRASDSMSTRSSSPWNIDRNWSKLSLSENMPSRTDGPRRRKNVRRWRREK